jgi:predicted acylesterase/phospholipase RssA
MNEQTPHRSNDGLHVVFGSGGSKAILGGAGAILAFEVGGLRNWLSIGSCSGGSLPAVFLASGQPAPEVLRKVIDTDFSRLLKAKTGLFWRLVALLFKYRHEVKRPERGVYNGTPLQDFVHNNIGEWPARFWTIASGRKAQYIFTEQGAFKECGGKLHLLNTPRPTLGTAVNATCAVPGFIDGIRFNGDILHDGALSPHGECPATVPVMHLGATPNQVLAFDIAEEALKKRLWLKMAWRLACMRGCGTFEAQHVNATSGFLVIKPNITGFHGLQFDLPRDLKWRAICTGFLAAVETLRANNLVPPANADALQRLQEEVREIVASKQGAPFTSAIEALLTRRNLLVSRK